MAALHYGICADSELLPALAAMVKTGCRLRDWILLGRLAHHALRRESVNAFLLFAEWANRAIRPTLSLKVLASLILVIENRISDVKHGLVPVDIVIGA
jgi:hypothetical protein